MNGLAGKLFGKSKKKLGTLTSEVEEKLDKKRKTSPTVEKDIKVDGIRGMREEKREEEKRGEEKEEKRGEKGEHLSLGQEEIEQAISRRDTIPTLQNYDSHAKVILKIYYSKENINTRCKIDPRGPMLTVWENFIEVLQSKYYLVGGGGKTAYVESITRPTLEKLKKAIAVRYGVTLGQEYVEESADEADFILMYGHYADDVVASSVRGDVVDKPFTILSYHSVNIGKFGGLTFTNAVGKMKRVTNKAGKKDDFGAVAGHSVEFISYVFPYLMGKAVGIEPSEPRFVKAVAQAYSIGYAVEYVSALNSITNDPNTLSSYLKLDYDVLHESRSFEEDEDFPTSYFVSRKTNGRPGIFSTSDEIELVDKLAAGGIDLLDGVNQKTDIDTAQQIIDIIYPTEERYEAAGEITMVVNIETFNTYIDSRLDESGSIDTFLRGLLNINIQPLLGNSGPFNKARHGPASDGVNFLHGLRGGRKTKKKTKKKSKKGKKRNVKTRKK